MRMTLGLTATVLTLAAAGGARAAEGQASPKAIIEKGIEARGGAEKLSKAKAVTFKANGKFYGMGNAIDFTGEWSVQRPDKMRMHLDFEANEMKFDFTTVFNGKEGWTKINDNVIEMTDDAVAEAKEDMYAGKVDELVPLLKDKAFKLAAAGESKVGDKPVVGVKVSHEGHRDITLYFDKSTGLLVKTERTVKDQMQGGRERTQVTVYSDYKDVDGVKEPMKAVVTRDGDKYVESETTEYKTHAKLEDTLFAKP